MNKSYRNKFFLKVAKIFLMIIVTLALVFGIKFIIEARIDQLKIDLPQNNIVGSPKPSYKPSVYSPPFRPKDVLRDVNVERKKKDLLALVSDLQLEQAALLKAKDMCENNYYAHTSPKGVTPWDWIHDVDFDYSKAGENLAEGFFDTQSMTATWMSSPEHKKNIIDKNFKVSGISVYECDNFMGRRNTIVVQLFAQKAPTYTQEQLKEIQASQQENLDKDIPVHCNISSECGGGTIPLKIWECEQSTCCEKSDGTWVFYKDKNKCIEDQRNGL